jgi:hypothetical protein
MQSDETYLATYMLIYLQQQGALGFASRSFAPFLSAASNARAENGFLQAATHLLSAASKQAKARAS